ncbi:MAG: pantetheine-phosphate adenylyltransferase [Bacteroidales bacterium]|jgi:pantetheine-phosphate adenylyltransferase|nr:pantetheine-phosphate adenylyltransferase [Bacteroidales bacterium]
MKIAVFAGTFDPFTIGHQDIVNRAISIFDKIIIAIGVNEKKKTLFSLQERIDNIKKAFINNDKIVVETYTGLTGEFCKKKGAQFLIRGIRNSVDFQYENDLAQANNELFCIETVFFITSSTLSHISSSLVRELFKNNGNYQQYLP